MQQNSNLQKWKEYLNSFVLLIISVKGEHSTAKTGKMLEFVLDTTSVDVCEISEIKSFLEHY